MHEEQQKSSKLRKATKPHRTQSPSQHTTMLNPNAVPFVPAVADTACAVANRKPAADPSAPGTSKKMQRQQAAAAYAASIHDYAPMTYTMLTEEVRDHGARTRWAGRGSARCH
jgi:hypothetical protein